MSVLFIIFICSLVLPNCHCLPKTFENKQNNSSNEGNTVNNNITHGPNKRNTKSIHNLSRTNNNGYKHISKHHRNTLNNKINRIVNKVLDPPTYITNLSSKTLTAEQNKILTLGLNYVPSTRCKPPAILEAVSSFKRLNSIKHFFINEPARRQHL